MKKPSRKTSWLISAVVLVALSGVMLSILKGGGNQLEREALSTATVPTYRLDADHATFATVDEIKAAAAVIVVGTIQSHSTVPGDSPGKDGAGDPLPAIPHTDYAVEVTSAIKGSPVVGETITVSLTGGATPDGKFVLDGGPILGDGDSALFFLGSLADGKYYPLAGGAAVAEDQTNGSFTLPPDATGEGALAVTEADVRGPLSPTSDGSTQAGVAAPITSHPTAGKKPLKCKKGFKKKKIHGKARCVKVKHYHKKHKKHKKHK